MAEENMWSVEASSGWTYRILVGQDGLDGFLDVEVESPEGLRWVGTVGSLVDITDLMGRYAISGECLGGAYSWVADFVIVSEKTESAVFSVLKDLARTGEIDGCFEQIGPGASPV